MIHGCVGAGRLGSEDTKRWLALIYSPWPWTRQWSSIWQPATVASSLQRPGYKSTVHKHQQECREREGRASGAVCLPAVPGSASACEQQRGLGQAACVGTSQQVRGRLHDAGRWLELFLFLSLNIKQMLIKAGKFCHQHFKSFRFYSVFFCHLKKKPQY